MPEPSAANQASPPRPPTGEWPHTLGDFELLDRVGQGAMGTVFKARQRSMDRLVAVKVLRPSLAGDAAYVERFLREARAAARLSHPNIVLAITVGEDQGLYYFAMEYVEGHTVSLLLKAGPLEERRALQITLQVAQALDHAWSQVRIVHRDIKPGNILLTADGTAKLADLGIAHDATLEEDALEAGGKIVGTPFYIAPEQILRKPDLDVRCDLYALGATLFHMVTGRPPFEGRKTKAILAKHLHEEAPDPRERRPGLGDATAYIIQRLLAKERDDRYPDAKALVADIEAALRGEPVGQRLAPLLRVRRPVARGASLSASLLLTLVLVIILIAAVVVGLRALSDSDSAGRKAASRLNVRPPPPGPLDPHQAAAERAWKEAVAYADAHQASNPVGAIERLRAVERRFHDTPVREQAAERRLVLEADLERSNREALRGITQRSEALVKETRYADALAIFQRPAPGLAADGWRDRVAAAQAAIERQARDAFSAALARGDSLAERGQLDDAVRAYETAGASLPDAWRAEAAARVAAARSRHKDTAEKAGAEREAAYLRLMAELADLYRSRKYDDAAALVRGRLDSAPAQHQEDLARELAEAAKLQEFWARAERGVNRVIGQQFVIRGIQGELVSLQNGRLTIRTRGGSFSEEFRGLSTDQILALGLPEYTTLDGPVAAARFLAAEGKPDGAEAQLKRLGAGSGDAAALRERMRRFEAAALFAGAAKDIKDAQQLLAAGNTEGAAAALRTFLKRFGDLPAAAALCTQAQRLLAEATAPKPARWGYVGGRAVARPEANVRSAEDSTVYLTERYGLRAYRIPLPNGTYLVRLHFAETLQGMAAVGQRIFSVAIEGKPALTDFDVFREAGRQRLTPVMMEFDIAVADGELTIEFTPRIQAPMVNAIEVLTQQRGRPRDALLINCGASQDYVDKAGRTWKKDQEYQGQ